MMMSDHRPSIVGARIQFLLFFSPLWVCAGLPPTAASVMCPTTDCLYDVRTVILTLIFVVSPLSTWRSKTLLYYFASKDIFA
jgi:hypothetical protein